MPDTIGFIGLGIMGRPMAHNVLKAGFPLVVLNRHQGVTDEFLAVGARVGTQKSNFPFLCKHIKLICLFKSLRYSSRASKTIIKTS